MSRHRPQQAFAFAPQLAPRREHGGDVRSGRRKLHRPLDPALHQHVVLRSSLARGERSFLHRRHRSRVERILYSHARKQGLVIDRFAKVGNHLHLLVKFPTPEAFRRFLKTVAGLIARAVTGARKGAPLASGDVSRVKRANPAGRRFWDGLAHSRAVTWGRELRAVRGYLAKNRLEAIGFQGARLKFQPDGAAVVVVGELPEDVRIDAGHPGQARMARLFRGDSRPQGRKR